MPLGAPGNFCTFSYPLASFSLHLKSDLYFETIKLSYKKRYTFFLNPPAAGVDTTDKNVWSEGTKNCVLPIVLRMKTIGKTKKYVFSAAGMETKTAPHVHEMFSVLRGSYL